MSEINFFFWLQGYFEISAVTEEAEADFTPKQKERFSAVVRGHIDLVKTTCTEAGRKPSAYLLLAEDLIEDVPGLRKVIGSFFHHVVEPGMPSPDLDFVHAAGAMRC